MEILTPYQIAAKCEDIEDPVKNRRAILKLFKEQDESHLWPINSRFNVTLRAARRVGVLVNTLPEEMCGLEYALALDSEISNIVNGEV